MQDFGEKRWEPEGSRPHVYLVPGPSLMMLCDEVLDEAGPLTDWYSDWRDVARIVEPGSRHVTLGWMDLPTASTPKGSWDELADTLESEIAGTGPVTLTCEKLFATTHGVILTIARTPELDRLAAGVGKSLRKVFGDRVRIVTESNPHLAVFYGCGVAETPALARPVGPVVETNSEAVLVDHDTFGSGRWDAATMRPIALAT